MKSISTILSTVLFAGMSVMAIGGDAPPEAVVTYASPTTSFYYTENESECLENGGIEYNEGVCVVEVEDIVELQKQNASNRYVVSVSTWGSNLHSCNFEGIGKLQGNQIISRETSGFEDGQYCTVAVNLIDAETVNVVATGDDCRNFCGARAWGLSIEEAKRKN
ncbi:hypothetical protein GW915_12400 [bacterium]|nr:hypothetical protein [bacterium]